MNGGGIGGGIGVAPGNFLPLFPLHARIWRAAAVFDKAAASAAVFDKAADIIIETQPEE